MQERFSDQFCLICTTCPHFCDKHLLKLQFFKFGINRMGKMVILGYLPIILGKNYGLIAKLTKNSENSLKLTLVSKKYHSSTQKFVFFPINAEKIGKKKVHLKIRYRAF